MSERYIFAVAEASSGLDAAGLVGFGGAPLEAIEHDGVAAFVGPVDARSLRPRRRNLKVHHDAVNGLMEQRAVLPMAFGMVAASDDEVRDFLGAHAQALRDQLELVRGRVELSLKVRLNVEDLFAHVVSVDAELSAMRDALFAGGREPSHEEKIELGRAFARRLEAQRDAHTAEIVAALEPLCDRLSEGDVRADGEVANLALLVTREEYDALEAAVFALAGELDDALLVTITGPIAPYSFIRVGLD